MNSDEGGQSEESFLAAFRQLCHETACASAAGIKAIRTLGEAKVDGDGYWATNQRQIEASLDKFIQHASRAQGLATQEPGSLSCHGSAMQLVLAKSRNWQAVEVACKHHAKALELSWEQQGDLDSQYPTPPNDAWILSDWLKSLIQLFRAFRSVVIQAHSADSAVQQVNGFHCTSSLNALESVSDSLRHASEILGVSVLAELSPGGVVKDRGQSSNQELDLHLCRPASWYSKATSYQLTADTLRKANASGRLTGMKIKGRWWYPIDEVKQLWPNFAGMIRRTLEIES